MVMASVSGSVARNSVFFWLAKSATAEADVGEEGAGQEGDVLARQQLLGDAHRIARRGAVVAEHDLHLAPAEHAALGVDLVLRQLHAVAIGHGERGHAAVGVELADLDGLGLACAACGVATAETRTAKRGAASASEKLRRDRPVPYMLCLGKRFIAHRCRGGGNGKC